MQELIVIPADTLKWGCIVSWLDKGLFTVISHLAAWHFCWHNIADKKHLYHSVELAVVVVSPFCLGTEKSQFITNQPFNSVMPHENSVMPHEMALQTMTWQRPVIYPNHSHRHKIMLSQDQWIISNNLRHSYFWTLCLGFPKSGSKHTTGMLNLPHLKNSIFYIWSLKKS